MHFLVKLSIPLNFSEYQMLVKSFKDFGRKGGIEFDEFGDCCDIDREIYKKEADSGKLNYFEGSANFTTGQNNINRTPEVEAVIKDFFEKENIKIIEINI